MSGIVSDARILIDHARVESQNHTFNFNEPMGIEPITQAVSDLAINFGEDTRAVRGSQWLDLMELHCSLEESMRMDLSSSRLIHLELTLSGRQMLLVAAKRLPCLL